MAVRGEEVMQARAVRWSRENLDAWPDLIWLYHCPNGGIRTAVTAMQMTALGVRRGVPDLILPVRRGVYVGLVIEMKAEKGRTSPEQDEWLAHYRAQGWRVEICYSDTEAIESLKSYLSQTVGTPGSPVCRTKRIRSRKTTH